MDEDDPEAVARALQRDALFGPKLNNFQADLKTLLESIEYKLTGRHGTVSRINTTIFYKYISEHILLPDSYDEDDDAPDDEPDSKYLINYISECLEYALTKYMAETDYAISGGSAHNVDEFAEAFKQRITQILSGTAIEDRNRREEDEAAGGDAGGDAGGAAGGGREGGGKRRRRTKRRRTKRRRTKRRRTKRRRTKRRRTKRRKSNKTRKRKSRRTRKRRTRR